VYNLLKSKNLLKKYPLFSKIYEIAYDGAPVGSIIDGMYMPNVHKHNGNGGNGGNYSGKNDDNGDSEVPDVLLL
jgi:hypothetical protein